MYRQNEKAKEKVDFYVKAKVYKMTFRLTIT